MNVRCVAENRKRNYVFLCTNFELKQVAVVSDFGCFEKLGPVVLSVWCLSFFGTCRFSIEYFVSVKIHIIISI